MEEQMIIKRQKRDSVAETLLIFAGTWTAALFIYTNLDNSSPILWAAAIASVLTILMCIFPVQARRIIEFVFCYRWALALLVFCVCVCLHLHGSSIGIYDELFPTHIMEEETTLFGTPRWIRSDEFGVKTPTYFSQAANGYGLYSQQMSLSPTNMVLDYYSPVWDWTILGKPMA